MTRLREFRGVEGTDFFEQDRGLQTLLGDLLPDRFTRAINPDGRDVDAEDHARILRIYFTSGTSAYLLDRCPSYLLGRYSERGLR